MLAESQAQNGPFQSLAELRLAHANLMRESRKEGNALSPERVGNFIERAQATGTLIENQNDRDSAQGVIDYWCAWQFSPSRRASGSTDLLPSGPPTLAEYVPVEPVTKKPEANPYVGLRAFDEKDAALFIGREEATRSLLSKVRSHRITFVTGPLGSGKTSLVFAGVVPRLRSRSVLETKKEPVTIVVVPGSLPNDALLKAVLQVATVKPADTNDWISRQGRALGRKPEALLGIVKSVAPGQDVLLIVDQFEEIFTVCADVEARDQFIQAITGLVEDSNTGNRVILIIRGDYAQQSFAMAALKPFAADLEARFSPPQLTSAELVRVINASAEAAGLRFDDGIVEDLAQDVAGDPASLPTLQFTLSRLWASLPPDSNRITREIYTKVGKPREALAQAAEAAFNRLSPEQQRVAQRVFLELVLPTLGDDVRRRRIPLDNLAQLTGDSTAQIAAVMKHFEDAELVRRTRGLDADDDRFEVTHEALVGNWKRLGNWVKEKKEKSDKKLQLITTARLWRESGQNAGYLLTGDAIRDAMPYRDQEPEIRDLIAASEASMHREKRIQAGLGGVLAAIMLAGAAVIVLLYLNKTLLSRDYDERDRQIQVLQDQLAIADTRLREADSTIGQLQDQIGELRKQARTPPIAPYSPDRPSIQKGEFPSTNQEGWLWAGSESDPNLRDDRNDPLPPSALVVGRRYVMARNVVLRSDKPSDTYALPQSLGLVLSGTPVTVLGQAVPYDRPSGTKQYWLRVRVDPSNKPIVYYQFTAPATKSDVQPIADAIQAQGYRIPETQAFDLAKGLNEVRYFFPADKPAATKLAQDVTKVLRDKGINLPATKVIDPVSPPLDRNYPGVLELWLDTSRR